MEWTEGIEAHEGQMMARVVSTNGRRRLVGLRALIGTGLPTCQSPNMRLKRVPLQCLIQTDGRPYLAAFGFDPSSSDASRHIVFRLDSNGRQWLIPALAFQRGLFKPNQLMFEPMFRPQAVHQLCVPGANGIADVAVVAPWARLRRQSLTDPRPLLHWLSSSESGRRTGASVHWYAVHGRLGVEMPTVPADISMQGLVKGDTVYVTRCSVNRVHDEACEASGGAGTSGGALRLNCARDERSIRGVAASLTVPRHADGSVALQDAEWAQIEPMVRPSGRASRTKVDLRVIIDGILVKLSGAEWKDLDNSGLRHQNYLHYYRKWTISGKIHEILSVLDANRTPCTQT